MKKVGLVLLLVLCAVGFAYDFDQIEHTRSAIVGALRGSLPATEVVAQFIPGYGVHVSIVDSPLAAFSFRTPDEVREVVLRLLPQLSGTIQGLDEGSFVSVGFTFRTGDVREFIAQVRVAEPDTLEVWVDGVKQ